MGVFYIFWCSWGNTGNPDVTEIAVNPLSINKLLTGGYSGTVQFDDSQGRNTSELLIGKEYGIEDVDFTGGCTIAINKQRLFFDSMGRPFYGGAHLQTESYKDETNAKLLKTTCNIELCTETCTAASVDKKITIAIEPETGYAHIL